MRIDDKYQIRILPFELEVVKAIDFQLEPTFLLEKDAIGNSYLTFLLDSDENVEQRAILPVSQEKLIKILAKEITLSEAFNNPENNSIYIVEYSLETGDPLKVYLIPQKVIKRLNIIPEDYTFDFFDGGQVSLDEEKIITYSIAKRKVVFDLYLKSQNLVDGIRPYAISKVLIPFVDTIKSMLGINSRRLEHHLVFSNIRQSSFGVTIEIDDPNDLFIEKEINASKLLINLLNADDKTDFENITTKTKKSNYIRHYSQIIKAIIENDAQLYTAMASPFENRVYKSIINKQRAEKVKTIIDEAFDVIEDIEIVKGIFLEIDIAAKEPTFKILNLDDQSKLRGKIELSLREKLSNDYVNIGKEPYEFTIKTIYHPETSVRPEKIERFLIDYKKNK